MDATTSPHPSTTSPAPWPSSMPRTPLLTQSARDQVLALPPPVEQAVVVAPGEPLALGLGQRFPQAMLVPLDRQAGHDDRTAAPPVPEPEAELEVGQPVEAEVPVEAAGRQGLLPTEGEHVSLQGVDLGPRVGVEVPDPALGADAE